jgi:hypothetical protein
MIVFRRHARADSRVGFDLPPLDEKRREELILEIGLIARDAGGPRNREPAQLYRVKFKQADGNDGDRVGGFSVPAEIADAVAAALVSRGYSVE